LGVEASAESDACCLYIKFKNTHIGDIYLFTRFSDGLSRRYHAPSGTYYNAKMTIPSYFYSGSTSLCIRNKSFSAPLRPDLVVSKIYGPDWKIPLARGSFSVGRNKSSGAVLDSDLETLLMYALEYDTAEDYKMLPLWPANVIKTNSKSSIEWIFNHEPSLHSSEKIVDLSSRLQVLISNGDCNWKLHLLLSAYVFLVSVPRFTRVSQEIKDLKKRITTLGKSRFKLEQKILFLEQKILFERGLPPRMRSLRSLLFLIFRPKKFLLFIYRDFWN